MRFHVRCVDVHQAQDIIKGSGPEMLYGANVCRMPLAALMSVSARRCRPCDGLLLEFSWRGLQTQDAAQTTGPAESDCQGRGVHAVICCDEPTEWESLVFLCQPETRGAGWAAYSAGYTRCSAKPRNTLR